MSNNYKNFLNYKEEQTTGANKGKYLGYNNQYDTMPAFMQDGRLMNNSWQPGAENNVAMLKENNITNSWQYRQHMIKNADAIREYNHNECCREMGCGNNKDYFSLQGNNITDKMSTPYLYNSPYDKTQPKGYTDSDLKNKYLTREELNSRKVSLSINQEELLKHPR
tara:strand:+ start:1789 stop:2286 length:498 start_codon:yes stop_codon:yes gene_type:complete